MDFPFQHLHAVHVYLFSHALFKLPSLLFSPSLFFFSNSQISNLFVRLIWPQSATYAQHTHQLDSSHLSNRPYLMTCLQLLYGRTCTWCSRWDAVVRVIARGQVCAVFENFSILWRVLIFRSWHTSTYTYHLHPPPHLPRPPPPPPPPRYFHS